MDSRDTTPAEARDAVTASSPENRHDRRGRFHRELRIRDAKAPEPLQALAYMGPSGYRTYAAPHKFVGGNGKVYLVKDRAQEGLGAELIANRIAHALGVGPECQVLRIGAASLPTDGRADHLRGLRVGTVEITDAFNDDELRAYDVRLRPDQVDWLSFATVVAFQTWVYAGDPQAIIRASDGRVFSIDHGAYFRELVPGRPTGLIVPRLHGITGSPFDRAHAEDAIRAIESITESQLLSLVSGVPADAEGWRMGIERRTRLVDWLVERQPGVREVMGWMHRLS